MKVAIYCRLSEEDRNKQSVTDDSNSIQNQKAMLLQYAMEQGWEVYNIYSDDDYTGADRRRPNLTGCWRMPSIINSRLYFAKISRDLPVSWSWLKNISMVYFLFGGFVLSVSWTMRIRLIKGIKNQDRLTDL